MCKVTQLITGREGFKPRSANSGSCTYNRCTTLGTDANAWVPGLQGRGLAQAHLLTLESQELGTVAVDRGGQRSPACQVLEAGHGRKAGGASGHGAVLAISDLWVGAGSRQRSSWPPPRSAVMQAGRGGLGFPPRGGVKPGVPEPEWGGPAWSRGRAAARGRGGVCEQPGQQRGLGTGTPGTLGWGIRYHGGFAPRLLQTEGNCVLGGEEQLSAGREGC